MALALRASGRILGIAIGVVLLAELAALPWTAHAYDAASFLSHADRVYFAHVKPTLLWAFGSIPLGVLLLSQLPVAAFPALWDAVPLRLFLLKLPPWCADVVSAGIVRACSSDPRAGNFWALRYLLDPIVVFVTVFHGQSDAIPNVFALGGIAAMLTERYELAGVLLGLGAGSKFYPAAFVPLLAAAALRRSSWRRAAWSVAAFFGVAAATLLPVLIGRAASVAGAWANNSFGPQGTTVATASPWTLFPYAHLFGLTPQREQFVAIAVPIALALWELRHVPSRRDLARAAMFAAMSIVLLNPGSHPPFYLWMAGPLVLYAAVADDGVVSLAGVALSCLGIATQFCQEGSDEYFLLNYGPGSDPGLLRCVAPFTLLQGLTLLAAAVVVVAALNPASLARRAAPVCRGAALVAAALFFLTFGTTVAVEAHDDAIAHLDHRKGFYDEEALVNTFAVPPAIDRRRDGSCVLTYAANDIVVYAGNPYAARFASATLGYTLFEPSQITIRGRTFAVASLPSRYERSAVLTLAQKGVTLTREFDVSRLLRPYRYVERFVERPCNLIDGNPVLIYRFNFAAARDAAEAAKRPGNAPGGAKLRSHA